MELPEDANEVRGSVAAPVRGYLQAELRLSSGFHHSHVFLQWFKLGDIDGDGQLSREEIHGLFILQNARLPETWLDFVLK